MTGNIWLSIRNPTCGNYLSREPISRRATYMHLPIDPEEPRTLEEVAAAFGVPVEAVQEAIAYCRSEPAEMHQDFQDQETWFSAQGFRQLGFPHKEA